MNDASSRESIFTVFHDNSLLFKVNKRYIAPLLLAYDDRIKEKQAMLQTYEVNNHLYMIYTHTLTWQYPIVYIHELVVRAQQMDSHQLYDNNNHTLQLTGIVWKHHGKSAVIIDIRVICMAIVICEN